MDYGMMYQTYVDGIIQARTPKQAEEVAQTLKEYIGYERDPYISVTDETVRFSCENIKNRYLPDNMADALSRVGGIDKGAFTVSPGGDDFWNGWDDSHGDPIITAYRWENGAFVKDESGNSGYNNTGCNNSGYGNTGFANSGSSNTGNYNSGNGNTGEYNSGWDNTGNHNVGHYNVGNYNTGRYNTGDFNTGSHNTGCFMTTEPTISMFNKPTSWTYKDWRESDGRGVLCEMPQKPESRQLWWDEELEEDEKGYVTSLPNFDADIFFKCTGIRVQ